jgi:hypothetical protein
MIRQAKHSDIPAIVALALESVSIDPLPVKSSPSAMKETLQHLVGMPMHFVWVTEIDGEVVAAVVAQCAYGFWFERQQCSVLLYYTRVPGGCMPLLRKLAQWIKSRTVIRLAVIELEPGVDERLITFLARLGFARRSTNLAYVRGNT